MACESARAVVQNWREAGLASLDESILRVVAGDATAFRVVVEATQRRLFRVAARMLGDEQEAEDVLQDSYIRAYDALLSGRFDGRAAVETWLYRIVANAALDSLRARKRKRRQLSVFAAPDDAPAAEAADARLALRELGALLETLPPEQRAALVLKEVEGLTAAEVAQTLERSVGAVEQLLVRARATLRGEIAEGRKLHG